MIKAKAFIREKVVPQKSGSSDFQFVINEAWMADLEKVMTINQNKVNASKNAVAEPGSKPWFLIHLVVGRSRTHRYIATDGKKYHDLQGIRDGGYRSTARRHGKCIGPWEIVDLPFRLLNQNAFSVIKKSINAFWAHNLEKK